MGINLQEERRIRVELEEGAYVVKTIQTQSRKFREAVELRHKIFCEELRWLPSRANGVEVDQYDEHAIHFGAINWFGELVGYSRIVLSEPLGFMLENEMAALLPPTGVPAPREEAIEISRLAVAPVYRKINTQEGYKISSNLYKAMYHWTKLADKRYWLIEAERSYLRVLQLQCFDFRRIGQTVEFQEGVKTVAAMMDIRDTEKKMYQKKPELFFWFQKGLPQRKMARPFK